MYSIKIAILLMLTVQASAKVGIVFSQCDGDEICEEFCMRRYDGKGYPIKDEKKCFKVFSSEFDKSRLLTEKIASLIEINNISDQEAMIIARKATTLQDAYSLLGSTYTIQNTCNAGKKKIQENLEAIDRQRDSLQRLFNCDLRDVRGLTTQRAMHSGDQGGR